QHLREARGLDDRRRGVPPPLRRRGPMGPPRYRGDGLGRGAAVLRWQGGNGGRGPAARGGGEGGRGGLRTRPHHQNPFAVVPAALRHYGVEPTPKTLISAVERRLRVALCGLQPPDRYTFLIRQGADARFGGPPALGAPSNVNHPQKPPQQPEASADPDAPREN